MAKLHRIAHESIAPYDVELIIKDGSVSVSDELPTELYGVKITEES